MPILVLILAACTPDDGDTAIAGSGVDPLTFPVDAPGPYNVGLRMSELTYEPRPGETRTIGLNVWYPTEDTEGPTLSYVGIDPADGTLGDATPIAPPWAEGFPVIAYSHGDRAYGGSSADLMVWFASHGWVAVAPDHTDNLLVANTDPTPQGHWYHRPLDVRAAVAALHDQAWLGPVDTRPYLLTGHSRGASTVWTLLGATFAPSTQDAWCSGCTADQVALFDDLADPDVAAAIPLAGTYRTSFFGEGGWASVDRPVMSLTGTEDPVGQQDQWDLVQLDDFTWIDIEGACHQTFALGACGTLDTARGFTIVDTYALAFGRHHVLGDDSVAGILDGSVSVDGAARLEQR